MKKITIAIIIIVTILISLSLSFLDHRKKEDIDKKENINKIYNDINDVHKNLDNISDNYIKVWTTTINNGQISKKEISEIIEIDYNKFQRDTSSEKQNIFTKPEESIKVMNLYYDNSGIEENIKNKIRNIRVNLESLKAQNDFEKNLYNELLTIYNNINSYYEIIFKPSGEIVQYKENIQSKKENIQILIENLNKKN